MPSSYAIGPHFEAMIQDLIAEGRYANASEVVRAGLRLLEEHEAERKRQYAELLAKIDEGMRSLDEGRVIPAEEVFAKLRAMIAERQIPDAAE